MFRQFETERFDLVIGENVRIANHHFGHNKQGELEVWIESGASGERFSSQIIVQGESYAVRKQIYAKKCYILREKASGRHYFLDMNDCGFWLHSETFLGAETFSGNESVRIQEWLAGANELRRLGTQESRSDNLMSVD